MQTQVGGLEAVNYSYDARGRLVALTQGSGAETRTSILSYNPQGFAESFTDPLGQATRFGYDPTGRITRQILPDGRVIQWSYDGNGNVVGITPPSRPPHGFAYTSVDLEERYSPPAVPGVPSPGTQYSYNADKDLVQIARPDGQSITLSYDAAGRLASMTMPHGTLSHSYTASGQLASISAPGGITTSYTYDGFLPAAETWAGAVNGIVSRTYNNDFRVSNISVNGNAIAFGYDADNLLTQAGALSLTRHAQHGLITATTLGSTTTAYNYNGFGELQSFTASNAGSNLYALALSRDPRGHITQKSETVAGQSDTFGYNYDATGRLTAVTKNGVQVASYGYDQNGNRTSLATPLTTMTGTYDDQDRLLSYGANTYSYTANGELKAKTSGGQTTTYSYDVLGNLRAVALPNGTNIEYVIDGRNRRIGKKVNGSLLQGFLYENDLRPAAELDGSGNVVSRFVYGEKPNIPEYFTKGGNTYRILTDHLGSPRLIVNTATGAVEQRMDYDEFGNILQDTHPGFQPFGFAGGLYDRDTKLTRFGARDYDPETGRWTAKDPIRFRGGDANLYAYVLNNPLRYTDPRGLDVVDGWEPSGPIGSDPINWGWRYDNWYGNWCGPGGVGRTISGVDCACKRHDQCYEDCGLDAKNRWLTRSGLGSGCALKCDTELASNPSRNDCDQCSKQ